MTDYDYPPWMYNPLLSYDEVAACLDKYVDRAVDKFYSTGTGRLNEGQQSLREWRAVVKSHLQQLTKDGRMSMEMLSGIGEECGLTPAAFFVLWSFHEELKELAKARNALPRHQPVLTQEDIVSLIQNWGAFPEILDQVNVAFEFRAALSLEEVASIVASPLEAANETSDRPEFTFKCDTWDSIKSSAVLTELFKLVNERTNTDDVLAECELARDASDLLDRANIPASDDLLARLATLRDERDAAVNRLNDIRKVMNP